MKARISFLFVLIAFCLGCKKTSNVPSVKLLAKVTHTTSSGTDVTSFTYDDKNRITAYSNDASKDDFKFIYDASDRIIEQDYTGSTVSIQYLYTYSGTGTIIANATNKFNSGATFTAVNTYTVNDKQQTTKLTYSSGDYVIFTYDAEGSLLTQSNYLKSSNALSYMLNYSLDTKNSPFANVAGNFFTIVQGQHVHSYTSEIYTTYSSGIPSVTTYANTFEYDGDGYPTKQTTVKTLPTGATSTEVYVYIYK